MQESPSKVNYGKTNTTVSCLCRLHNFLIDHGDKQSSRQNNPIDELTMEILNSI